nr:gtp-binding protein brassinazole insensitive pale green 2, chloroplastic [Quercus suber]
MQNSNSKHPGFAFAGAGELFDTPGLLHPHQITTRLTREEQKLVHISKELRPRTYRIKRYSISCYLEFQFGVALPAYW